MAQKLLFRNPTTGLLTQTNKNVVVEIGAIDSNIFEINGQSVILADGTLSRGGGAAVDAINLQKAYDNTDVADHAEIEVIAGKNIRFINSDDGTYFIYEPETGSLKISGDLEVGGSTSVVDNVITNYDTLSITPSLPGVVGLIIEPDPGVTPIAPLMRVKRLNGGTDVFAVLADGTVVVKDISVSGNITITGNINNIDIDTLKTTLNNHIVVSSNKHIASEINIVSGSYSASGVTQVQQAITSLDGRVTSNSSLITSLNTRVAGVESQLAIADGTTLTTGYEYEQSPSSNTWTITHNKNNKKVIVQVFDEDDNVVIPQNISATENVLYIEFATTQAGTARIVFFN